MKRATGTTPAPTMAGLAEQFDCTPSLRNLPRAQKNRLLQASFGVAVILHASSSTKASVAQFRAHAEGIVRALARVERVLAVPARVPFIARFVIGQPFKWGEPKPIPGSASLGAPEATRTLETWLQDLATLRGRAEQFARRSAIANRPRSRWRVVAALRLRYLMEGEGIRATKSKDGPLAGLLVAVFIAAGWRLEDPSRLLSAAFAEDGSR